MKKLGIALGLLFVLLFSQTACAIETVKSTKDTLTLGRLFAYRKACGDSLHGQQSEVYFRYNLQTLRRNATLFFVPSMYYVAKGRRHHVGEILGKVTFNDKGNYQMQRDVNLTTIPHGRGTMAVVLPYLTPDIYGATLFGNAILSPFHSANRRYYRYRVAHLGQGKCRLTFRPRLKNTQLITGYALLDEKTGRVERTRFNGEHDMLRFSVDVAMGNERQGHSLIPLVCQTDASFKFLGNSIKTQVAAYYDQLQAHNPADSLRPSTPQAIMEKVRPLPLTPEEQAIYDEHFTEAQPADTTKSEKSQLNRLADKAWNIVATNLLGSMGVESGNASLRVSPLVNPLYLSYSHSRGLAYKIKVGMRYGLGPNSELTLRPDIGYNFKIHQFYFNAPLRLTINARRDNYVELSWANGNRITNSSVLDVLKNENRDTVNFAALNLDYFKDEMWRLAWNTNPTSFLGLRIGTVYHRRNAVNAAPLAELGKPTVYRSFAPFITLTLRPFKAEDLVITANYERSLRRLLRSNTKYERWEFDGSYKKRLWGMRAYNLRAGGGFYTNRSTSYFVDFDNFHQNYIPGGWDDDWSGDFQLLNSQWYNASTYYLRANASYETPLLALSWLPLIGRYIEKESLYASALHIEHTRPYFELGYGLTTRYLSIGIFSSFLSGSFHEFGSKFTFELFRKW